MTAPTGDDGSVLGCRKEEQRERGEERDGAVL
jgi:hypothetical protein